MRRLLLLLLLLPLSVRLTAQVTPDYEAASSRVFQAYMDNPSDVAALLDLTALYRDSLNPMCNYGLAYKYVRMAEENFATMLGNRHQYKQVTALLRKGITIDSIRSVRLAVERDAVLYVLRAPSLSQAELTALSGAFRSCPAVVKVVEQRRLDELYLLAQHERTLESYGRFEQKYHGSDQALEARRSMTRLADSLFQQATTETEVDAVMRGYEDYEAIARLALKRKATLAYAVAAEVHTEEAYRDFLSRYPSADEYALALDQLDVLLAARFASLHTPRQWADFAHQHADSPLADEAMRILRLRIDSLQDAATAKIYFLEFPHDASYGELYRRYYLRHLAEGNSDPIVRFKEENPDFPYLSTIDQDLRAARARDSIDLMRPYSEAVFLDFARDVRRLEGMGLSFVALQRTMQTHLAARDWKACNERMDYFMFTFEESMAAPYAALRDIINAPADKAHMAATELIPAYHIPTAALHPSKVLFYTMQKGSEPTTIQTARFDGRLWRHQGAVRFDNLQNSNVRIYGFYDNGHRMLLGQGGDILIAERQDSVWHVVEIPPYPVNTDYEEYDAFMLPDGSGLLLASDRPGGCNLQHSRALFHGDTALASDLYFIPRSIHGWGEPINLGPRVNTPFCDHAPLLSSDLKTLYFISDGHPGLGYGDIFYCTREDVDDWTSWSEPRNYGKETNSGLREGFLSFAPDERTLLFSSNRGGRWSLYRVASRHTPVNKHVEVTLSAGKETLVDVVDLGTQCVVAQVTLPPDGQAVRLSLYEDKTYAIVPQSQTLSYTASEVLRPKKGLRVELREFDSDHAPAGPIYLPAALFQPATALLTTIGMREIDNLGCYLAHHEDIDKVYLSVHVPGDDDQQCFDLSRARAVALKRHLERLGVQPHRVLVAAYGNVNYQSPGHHPRAEVEVLW